MKRYKLTQGIYSPAGNVKTGTENTFEDGYYIFPYIGKQKDVVNGWLGDSFMVSDPTVFPEWFQEIKEPEEKERITVRVLPYANYGGGKWMGYYVMEPTREIPEEKLTPIKKAIESVLNSDAGEQFCWTDELVYEFARKVAFAYRNTETWTNNYTAERSQANEFKKSKSFNVSQKDGEGVKCVVGFDPYRTKPMPDKDLLSPPQPATPVPSSAALGKDWEIVELKGRAGNKNIYRLRDGLWLNDRQCGWAASGESFGENLESSGCDIHSVKRVSDSVVFSVGDEVDFRSGGAKVWGEFWSGKIISIKPAYNKDELEFEIYEEGEMEAAVHKYISNIRHKLPSPSTKDDNTFQVDNGNSKTNMPKEESKTEKPILFTTEDGVGIREGDRLWYVLLKADYKIHDNPANYYDGGNTDYKYFSNEKSAQEYVTMNKPCYSKKDLQEVWDARVETVDGFAWDQFRPLKYASLEEFLNDKK